MPKPLRAQVDMANLQHVLPTQNADDLRGGRIDDDDAADQIGGPSPDIVAALDAIEEAIVETLATTPACRLWRVRQLADVAQRVRRRRRANHQS